MAAFASWVAAFPAWVARQVIDICALLLDKGADAKMENDLGELPPRWVRELADRALAAALEGVTLAPDDKGLAKIHAQMLAAPATAADAADAPAAAGAAPVCV